MFNSSAKSNRTFYLPVRKYYYYFDSRHTIVYVLLWCGNAAKVDLFRSHNMEKNLRATFNVYMHIPTKK